MKEDLDFYVVRIVSTAPPPSIVSTEETEKRKSKREERVVAVMGVEGMVEPNPMAIKMCFVFLSTIYSTYVFCSTQYAYNIFGKLYTSLGNRRRLYPYICHIDTKYTVCCVFLKNH
jgi:hypothetical protein